MASDGEISCTNDPNFAVIYSFIKVFGKLYGLEIPTISKLQELIENTQDVLDPLKELHLRLLRRALKSVQSNRWERGLIKFCHQHGHHQEAWEIERFSYKKSSTPVKLKVLKFLLEYQFTCHPKFKSAVNALSCKELRLDPIGRDKSGCVYWLQVDEDANLCLYREDQDEETWQLIARNREELVKVIAQLKSGEDVCPSSISNANEDSSSNEIPPQLQSDKLEAEEDNEDEFLSPESESDNEEEDQKDVKDPETKESEKVQPVEPNEKIQKEPESNTVTTEIPSQTSIEKSESSNIEQTESSQKEKPECPITEKPVSPVNRKPDSPVMFKLESPDNKKTDSPVNLKPESPVTKTPDSPISKKPESPLSEEPKNLVNELSSENEKPECRDREYIPGTKGTEDETLSEEIEEPVMVVTGEGNGAECDSSYIIGEEIIESVMFFYGDGCGYDNDTGNPEAIERESNEAENSEAENGNEEECVNGANHELSNSSSKSKLVKNVKLKSKLPSVTKRTLKKQSTDNSEVLKPDTKKHCVRDLDKSDSCNSNSKSTDKDLKREGSINEKSTTDSESPNKNNVKKGRNKIKKKLEIGRKLRIKDPKELLNSVVETDNGHDSKTSIIEKRKSSLSSEDQDDVDNTENEKYKSPDKELKVEDTLPPKKLRLETSREKDNSVSHSKETVDTTQNVHNSEAKNQIEANISAKKVENNAISQRKKIKAKKGKFKRKKLQIKAASNIDKNNDTVDDKAANDSDHDINKDNKVVKNKSLKRSLLDATLSDKNKSESQTESEDDEPVTSGKRFKIKPKKIITSSRKKVEAKLQEKHSSDESEEETLYSIAAGKKSKKVLKKKPRSKEKQIGKGKEKGKKSGSEDSDVAPVRQSRRIAQLKIREEAERRHLEEVALRELKMIHKKRNKDDEEEWQASGKSSSESEARVRKKPAKWRMSDSTGPEPDSESDEPLFEHPEPDLEFTKSDHEFSPESDLESGEPVEPLKRARTLQEEKDDGFCKRCGSGEQPEWILLCDKCDSGYHASCLQPLLFVVPEGDWFCPPCNHDMLISSLEAELTKYDELLATVEAERARRKEEEPEKASGGEACKEEVADKSQSDESSSDWSTSSSSSEEEAVYRLRARRQLPVSYRSQEYDRLISSAIKEEYVEPTTSAGNQGRGKDISTIIEAAEEEKLKAEREALEQGQPVEPKKARKKQRRKPRKLNSLEVPSEDDDETDEDFKDTGMESSSEEISSSAERGSSARSGSSDDLPIRRVCRQENKDRPKMIESSPEVRKKKNALGESSSDAENRRWQKKSRSKSKKKKRDKGSSKKSRRRARVKGGGGLTQYDAEGNVIRARVTYGGLSGDEAGNDWSPKHRTRQKKINYTEMPNTESEDEMHKSSGKHMPDSSEEFNIDDSDLTSDSDSERIKRKRAEESEQYTEEKQRALDDLIKKTAVVPLEKLPEDVTKAKTEELQAHLDAQAAAATAAAAAAALSPRPLRGKGSRGGRGSRGPRGRGRGGGGAARASPGASDDALAKLVGVKIKEPDGTPRGPLDAEREKKRLEREAKQAEKEARKQERIQKKEEKEKMKEQKAKEREEKRLARLALQESKRMKKEKPEYPMSGPMGYGMPARPAAPEMQRVGMYGAMPRHPGDYAEQRFPQAPRLQVRAELRGVLTGEDRLVHAPHQPPGAGGMREVAGSPQPFKPVSEEPSIITRMPHMLNQQYRGPMMYAPGNSPYGPRAPQNMYPMHHPGLNHPQGAPRQYSPQGYYSHVRGMPPGYPTRPPGQQSPGYPTRPPGQQSPGSVGPPGSMQYGPGSAQQRAMPHGQIHGRPGSVGPPGSTGPHGSPGPIGHGQPGSTGPHRSGSMQHGPPVSTHGPSANSHGPSGSAHGPLGSPHGPPHGQPGLSHVQHGMSHGQPGSTNRPPGPVHVQLGSSHGPPGSAHGLPGPPHGPSGPIHGPPGSSHGPPGSTHGPPGTSHGPHGSSHGPPGATHGPPGTSHGPPGSSHGPHGPPGSTHGPPGSTHGPAGLHGSLGSMPYGLTRPIGPPGAHGSPGPSHGPPGPYGLRGPGQMPPGAMPPHPSLQGAPPMVRSPMIPPGLPPGSTPPAPPGSASPAGPPSIPNPPATVGGPATSPSQDVPIKIKAEVKTEPEYRSPPSSPSRALSPRDEPPRIHPKIKHTENKDRRPRFPLGPYAPQYGPYGPYAPPPVTTQPQDVSNLLNLQSRLHPSQQSPLQRMHQLHQFLPSSHGEKQEPVRSPPPAPLERPHLLHDVAQQLPPHYLPSHLRQIRPHYGMPMMRHPQPGRSSPVLPPHYPPQYSEIHRSALEKQLSAPAIPPQKPPSPPPVEPMPDKPESREPTPVPTVQPDKVSGEPPLGDKSPPQTSFKMGDNDVNKSVPAIKLEHIKEERSDAPREEGSVFGGLVSYFSSQHEDDIDN